MISGQGFILALVGLAGVSAVVIVILMAYSRRFRDAGGMFPLSTIVFSAWVAGTIILTPYTFALRIPGLPDMSLERLLFIALCFLAIVRIYIGRRNKGQNSTIEFFMFLFSAWCVISMARFGFIETYSIFARPTYVFLIGYFIPFLTFAYAKRFLQDEQDYRVVLKILFWFGAYLAFIAYLERFDLKAYVIPSYIVDPQITDLHLDRSRGPFLNAAFNGLALNIAFLCGLMALPSVKGPGRWMYLLTLAFYVPAIYFTRTRSVYVHFLLTLFMLLFVYKTRFPRWKILPLVALLVGILLAVNWQKLSSSNREEGGIGQTTEISIRLELADKSLRSIMEHPLGGIGLTQFRTASLFTPEDVEFQHNHLLGLAVELGLTGLGLYLVILWLVFSRLYKLCAAVPESGVANLNFILLIATALFVNLINNFFVEPTLHLFANMNFFLFAGMADSLYNTYCLPGKMGLKPWKPRQG